MNLTDFLIYSGVSIAWLGFGYVIGHHFGYRRGGNSMSKMLLRMNLIDQDRVLKLMKGVEFLDGKEIESIKWE